jgi:hypothetical protein
MIGRSLNETLNKLVKYEFEIYGDLVQENFIDSCYNLISKSVMIFKWISLYCSNRVYSIKIDDDVGVNFKLLTTFLNTNKQISNQIICLIVAQATVIRNTFSK